MKRLQELIHDVRVYIVIVAAVAMVSVVQSHAAHTDTKKTLTTIEGCITPGDSCQVQGQKNTAVLLLDLHRSDEFTQLCVSKLNHHIGPDAVTKVEHCVARYTAQSEGATK